MRPVPVVFLRLAFSDQLSVLPRCQHPALVLLPCLLDLFHGWVAVRARVGASVHVHFLVLAAGKPQEAHVCFWMCRDRRPVW